MDDSKHAEECTGMLTVKSVTLQVYQGRRELDYFQTKKDHMDDKMQ